MVHWLHGFVAVHHHQIMSAVYLYVRTSHTFVKILVWFCVSIFLLCIQCEKTVLRLKYNNSEAQGRKLIISVKTVLKGQVLLLPQPYKLCEYFENVPALMVFSGMSVVVLCW